MSVCRAAGSCKAKASGRLVLYDDGSIDAKASDARRAATTDPAKQRQRTAANMKPVPAHAVKAIGDTLDEQGLIASDSEGVTYLEAKTAHEVLKARERRIRIQKMKGELIDRSSACKQVFRLAREERDAWVTWPSRVAALMAADLDKDAAVVQRVLESHVRSHLEELGTLNVKIK
ncbi:MAG: hypothetical protein V6Z86_07285 [Hyphomicrobiales bacterium]